MRGEENEAACRQKALLVRGVHHRTTRGWNDELLTVGLHKNVSNELMRVKEDILFFFIKHRFQESTLQTENDRFGI